MQTLDRPANFFERFWITLDRAAPLAYEIFPYLKLKGGVKERLLQESYFKTLDAFPFLKEGVIIKNGKVYWSYKGKSIKDSFALRKIEGGEKEFQKLYKEIINYPRFDLTRQLGLKLYLIKCSDKTDYIVFRFSHLLMDWRGGTCFLEELCQCYNSLMKGLNPVFTKAGDKPFDDFIVEEKKAVKCKHFFKFLNLSIERFNPFSGKTIAYLAKYNDRKLGKFNFFDLKIEEKEFASIRSNAKARGWTVNDLVVAATYHMVKDWCYTNNISFNSVNISSSIDYRRITNKFYLKNFSSARVIKLFPEEIGNDEILMKTIQNKYGDIASSHFHYFIYFIFRFFSWFTPLSIVEKKMKRRSTKNNLFTHSITIANLGDIGENKRLQNFGNARITSFYPGGRGLFIPGYALTVFSFKSVFYVSLFYNEALLTVQNAESLGNKFLFEIKRLTE